MPSWKLTTTFSYIGQYHYEQERVWSLLLFLFSDKKTKQNANGEMLCVKHF